MFPNSKKDYDQIPLSEPYIDNKEFKYVYKCLKTGWLSSQGPFVTLFENRFATFCGSKYGVAVSSGFAAIHLALLSLGVYGQEVIVPTFTFAGTVNAIIHAGAKPLFVDSNSHDLTISTTELASKISNKTRAIIPVHIYGIPCNMNEIIKIAKQYGAYVIEDAAQAHGAEYRGKRVGSIGHIGCFSFYGNKIITTGEGGICLTDNRKIAMRIQILRDHGLCVQKDNIKKYCWPIDVGFNYRMSSLEAAVGLAQLDKINEILKLREQKARIYRDLLENVPLIDSLPEYTYGKPVYWVYPILLDKNVNRNKVLNYLLRNKVEAIPFYTPLHEMPLYRKYTRRKEKFVVAEEISRRGLCLPIYTSITREHIEHTVNLLKEASR